MNSQGYAQARLVTPRSEERVDIDGCHCIVEEHADGFWLAKVKTLLLLALPGVLSISLFLIADSDCPGNGVIPVYPQNLLSRPALLTHTRLAFG